MRASAARRRQQAERDVPAPGARVGPEGSLALPPAAAPAAKVTGALAGAVGGGREWRSMGEGDSAAGGGGRV